MTAQDYEAAVERREWVQKDGTPIAISRMSDRHVLASLAMLRRKGFIGPATLRAYLYGPMPRGEAAGLAFEKESAEVFRSPVNPYVDLLSGEARKRGLEA